jgi:hypothetical protein
MAMAWIFVLSPNIGWGNALLKAAFGLGEAPLNIYSMAGMTWALSSHYFPLAYLALGPALRVLDMRMEEAALMAGGSYGQVFARVTLPLLRPAILSALLLLFVMGMASYEVPRLIGRPARIDVFTTDIQGAIIAAPPAFGVASALSLTLLAIFRRPQYLPGHAEEIDTPPSEQQTSCPAQQGKQKAFAKQLPNNTEAAGTERAANGNFAAPRRSPRQQKIGYVCAGYQQDEGYGTEEDEQRRSHIPDDIGMQCHDVHRREFHVRVGVLLRHPSGNRTQFCFRLSNLDARFQPADDTEEMRPAIR